MKHTHVLLDLDGTLTDPWVGIFRCIRHALVELRIPVPTEADLRSWIGPPLQHSFTRYFEALGTRADPSHALDIYRQRFATVGLFENRVYPGIPILLEQLDSAGLRLLVATSKPRPFAARIVAHFGLDRWLDAVYGSELDGRRVDKVDLLQHILDRERLEAGRCVMVGDREFDMRAGRHHGMAAVGVLWGYGSETELRTAGAQEVVADMRHLYVTLLGRAPGS